MKGKLISFLIICFSILITNNVLAVQCGDTECSAGQYCTQKTSTTNETTFRCSSCAIDTQNKYTESNAGASPSDGIKACYTTCESKKTDDNNGTWAPDSEKIYAPNGACTYTDETKITCNTNTNPCMGFHRVGTQCINNKEICTGTNGKGYRIYPSQTCHITECDQGYHLENTKTTSCGDTYGKCEQDNKKCNKELSNCTGEISGDAPWILSQGKRDFSNCICTGSTQRIENGTGKRKCYWKSDKGNKTEWYDDDVHCTTEVTSCDIGYCLKPNDTNANSCDPAPRGYYHSSSDTKDCQSCPAGSTSNGTTTTDDKTTLASSTSACYIVRGTSGTKFCDGDGCFTLPGSGNIPWTGKQP